MSKKQFGKTFQSIHSKVCIVNVILIISLQLRPNDETMNLPANIFLSLVYVLRLYAHVICNMYEFCNINYSK